MKLPWVATPDWHALIRPGDRIACSHMSAEPVSLLRSLAAANPCGGDFEVQLGVPFSDAALAFGAATSLTTFGGMGSGGALAKARAAHLWTPHPWTTHRWTTHLSVQPYSQCAAAYERDEMQAEVVLLSLARDADGDLWLGAAHGFALAAARRARGVVVEVNTAAPVVAGAPWPDDLAITAAIEISSPLPEPGASAISAIERQIAAHVAGLVDDGACLQVGIGTLPSAVAEGLAGHRALGLHSGMLTPALWRLVEAGVVDNSRKAIDAGLSIAGVVYGDAALYQAVHRNPSVQLREPGYTHAAAVIARLDRFVALNSALEVDLSGQMNAETVRGSDGRMRHVGGVGGLNDFVRAAPLAHGGRSVIALPSRQAARAGGVGAPRIVAALSGPATIAACDADVVVTEHGIAHLRHVPLDERARRLIAIAHPDDRDALRSAVRAAVGST